MELSYQQELEIIKQKGNGFLRPQEVVDYARNPDTALHQYFEWDDVKAGEKYRLAQARAIIRVAVVVNPENGEKVQAYVSLRSDRKEGNSYRALVEVLDDEALTQALLRQAYTDMVSFQRKYQALKGAAELGGVLSAIDTALISSGMTQEGAQAA